MLVVSCGAQNRYSVNLQTEAAIAGIAEQYDVWYQLADPETQAEWKQLFDPAFAQLNLLMDSYHNMLAVGEDTTMILAEINKLKTQIMIELTRRMAEKEVNSGE
jgi:hypothetical protein